MSEINLQEKELEIIQAYLNKLNAMFAVLSPEGQLAFFHLIIDGRKELNRKRNELLIPK